MLPESNLPPAWFDIERLIGPCQKRRGNEMLFAECPYCGKDSKSGCFSYNPDVGAWNCLRCGEKGGWRKINRDFGSGQAHRDIDPRVRSSFNSVVGRPIESLIGGVPSPEEKGSPQETNPLQEKADDVVSAMTERLWSSSGEKPLAWLRKRGISDDVIRSWKLGADPGCRVVFPFYDATTKKLRRLKARNPADKDDMEYFGAKGGVPLFGAEKLDTSDPISFAVLVEGEMDALTLATMKVQNVVAVPGATMWKKHFAKHFVDFGRVCVATDADEEGDGLAQRIMDDIGHDRCVRVRFGEWKDANDALVKGAWTAEMFAKILYESYPGGTTHSTSLVELYGAAVERKDGILTEWSQFDSLFLGFRPGELTVVTGITGHGKTSWTLDTALRLAMKGEGVLYASMELDDLQFFTKVYSMLSGKFWPEIRFNKDVIESVSSQVTEMALYFIRRSRENSLASIDGAIRYVVSHLGVKFIVLDHLGFFTRTLSVPGGDTKKGKWEENIFAATERAVRHLSDLAKSLGVHVVLIAHQNATGNKRASMFSIKYGTSIPQDADNVIVVHRLEEIGGRKRSEIEIAKTRYDEASDRVSVKFDYDALRYRESTLPP